MALTDNLELGLQFEDNLNDEGSGGSGLTTKGTIQFGTGEVGEAYIPDASNNFKISSGTLADFGTNDFTVAFFFKFSADTNRKIVYDNPNFNMYYDSVDGDKMKVNDGSGVIMSYSNASNHDDTYHHMCWTRIGTANVLYIDGVSRDTATIQTDISFGDLDIGQANGGAEPVDGMDEFYIWSRGLSPAEVTILSDGTAYPWTTGTNMKINIADVFKDIETVQLNVGDAWKAVPQVLLNVGDAWKTVFG